MPEPLLPRVRVVVLNWNSAWFTRRCLAAVMRTDYPADRLEVVLVDNASADGSLEQLRHSFPDLHIVRNDQNLGFAEGCNRAMRASGADAVALVNNDAVPDPAWLRELVAGLDDPSVGAVAARLVLEPAFTQLEIQVTGGSAALESVRVGELEVLDRARLDGVRSVGRPDWPMILDHHVDDRATLLLPAAEGARLLTVRLSGTGTAELRTAVDHTEVVLSGAAASVGLRAGEDRQELLNGLGTRLGGDSEGVDRFFGEPLDVLAGVGPETVEGFCGGGVLLRAAMLDQVGVFDPTFFAYYEDTDLSWRARNAGWRTVTAPDAVIRHAFGGSAGSKARGFFFLNYRNWILTVARNADAAERRRAARSAWDRIKWAVRANLLSPLKHRRRPDTALVAAWGRVLLGAVLEGPHILRTRRRGRAGERRTDAVRSRLQPSPSARPPASRPGGPLVVYVDLTEVLDSPESPVAGAGRELVARLPDAVPGLDLVGVVRAADTPSGFRRLTSEQYGRLLQVPGPYVAADPTWLGLDVLTPAAVVLQLGSGEDPTGWRLRASRVERGGVAALPALEWSGDGVGLFDSGRTAAGLGAELIAAFDSP